MAGLVLGTVGSLIGGSFGGPVGAAIGYLVGSTLGNLLDPQKIEGPRISDLKLQHSTYGTMIPIVYGPENRLAGNVIWQTDLVEHKHRSGGKGGPQVTTYSYTASWQVRFCQCPDGPVLGLGKLWHDLRLVSTTGQSTDDMQFVFYKGEETALPDPTIEAAEGVGSVPASRGYCDMVYTDVDLSDYGNRIFQTEIELVASGDPTLDRISTWTPPGSNSFTSYGIVPLDAAYIDGTEIVVCRYEEDSPNSWYFEYRYSLLDGSLVSSAPVFGVDNVGDTSTPTYLPSQNSNIAVGKIRGAGSFNVSRWYVAGQRGIEQIQPPVGADEYYSVSGRAWFDGTFAYAPGHNVTGPDYFIGKWGMRPSTGEVAGVPETDYADLGATSVYGISSGADLSLTMSDDNYLYVVSPYDSTHAEMWKIDPSDMSIVDQWDIVGAIADQFQRVSNAASFTVFRGLILLKDHAAGEAALYTINANHTFTLVDSEASAANLSGFAPMLSLGGGYVLTMDGVLRIGAFETLANIYASVSGLCGLDASQYDVSALTDGVRGFRIGAQMTGKNALQPLSDWYFVSGAEVDDTVLFVKHDGVSVDTIPDEDLAAHERGTELPPLLETTRIPDAELPRTVNLVYINPNADYQPGTQYARRETTGSELDATGKVPITFTDDDALERVEARLYTSWFEREPSTWRTSRKYEALVPTDVVTVQGRNFRIVEKSSSTGGVITFRGVPHRAVILSAIGSGAGGGVSGGFVPPNPGSTTKAATQLVLLDIGLLSLSDAPYGFYAAMGPENSSPWAGATLYKSVDGGTTYKEIGSTDRPAAIGLTTTTLVAFPGGSPSIQSTGFTVAFSDNDAELTSCSATAIANGANKFAISATGAIPWAIGSFMTATLTAAQTYDVSGIIWEDGSNSAIAAGATFVMLDDVDKGLMVVNIDAPKSELNLPFLYKAVTWGKTLAGTPEQQFTNTGEGADTWGPPHTELLDTFIGDNATGPAPRKGLVPAPWVGARTAEAVLLSTDGASGSPSTYWGIPSWGGSAVTGAKDFIVAVSDETTAITTGTAKVTFRMPHAMTLTSVRANVNTASSSGIPTVDINIIPVGSPNTPVSILSTKLTIDANERTSVTAATAVVISNSALLNEDEITIDIDVAGTGTKGLKVAFIGT